jgi:hypothetical protein
LDRQHRPPAPSRPRHTAGKTTQFATAHIRPLRPANGHDFAASNHHLTALSQEEESPGAPSIAHFAIGGPIDLAQRGEEGWDENVQLSTTQLPVLFSETERIVISTEAAHGFIVSGAAEKSASLPRLFVSLPSRIAVPSKNKTDK